MLTLTSKPETDWPRLMRGWNAFRQWLKRMNGGKKLAYVAVKEVGSKTGMKHLHILFPAWQYIHYSELSARWKSLTGAFSVNVKRIPAGAGVSYVLKYATKATATTTGKGRTVLFSQGWPRPEPDETQGEHWRFEAEVDPSEILRSIAVISGGGYLLTRAKECTLNPVAPIDTLLLQTYWAREWGRFRRGPGGSVRE